MSNGLVGGVAASLVVLAVLVGMATLLSLAACLAVLCHGGRESFRTRSDTSR